MITVVCGLPGSGKSSLMTKFIKDIYFNEGKQLLRTCCNRITAINERRENKLTLPEKTPIFSDFEVKFLVGYRKYYSTYFLNGYYFGLHNNDVPVIYLPPFSKVFLTEVQRYYDSRKSKSLPDFVSRLFEMHRHNFYDIYLDLQRIGLLDLNIRDLSARIIEVCDMQHEYDFLGSVTSTTWNCHIFDCWEDFDKYLNGNLKKPKIERVTHYGDIFKCYDSYSYQSEFIPSEEDDFIYLKHKNEVGTIAYIQDKLKRYYDFSMPEGYRKRREAC